MNKYLEGIKKSDNKILQEIYQSNFIPVKNYIVNNSGNESDAKDVFQEVLIAFFRRLQKEDIEINVTFGTYLFSACKMTWFKKLKRTPSTDSIEDLQIADNPQIEEELLGERKSSLFQKTMNKLGEDCKKVLQYHFAKKSFKEIADLMEYTGEEYARRKKYLCKKGLMNKIKKDPQFKELYNA